MAPGVAGSLAFTILTVIYGRLLCQGRPRTRHLLGLWLVVAGILAATVALMETAHRFALVATNIAVYLFLSEAYVFVFLLSFGSVSIQIIVTMLCLEPAPDALDRTLAKHSAEVFLRIRLDSLLAQGLLAEKDGRYQITKRGQRWVKAGILLKKLLAVGVGG